VSSIGFLPGEWVAHPYQQAPDPDFVSNRAVLGENLGVSQLYTLERREPPR
jgi:hypothetical protein